MAGQTDNLNDGTSLLKEGLRLLEAGDIDAAITNFSRVIETEPGRAVAYRLRGSTHLRKRAYDSAIADLSQAIELAPKDAVAYYLRGRARQQTKDSSGAVADYDQAIALKPDYLKAFRVRETAIGEMNETSGSRQEAFTTTSRPTKYGVALSPRWKKRFALMERQAKGLPLTYWERIRLGSVLGMVFSFWYYLAMGMWKKGMALLALTLILLGVQLWLIVFFPDYLAWRFGFSISAIAGVLAIPDYYAHVVRKETMWPRLALLDKPRAIAALLVFAALFAASAAVTMGQSHPREEARSRPFEVRQPIPSAEANSPTHAINSGWKLESSVDGRRLLAHTSVVLRQTEYAISLLCGNGGTTLTLAAFVPDGSPKKLNWAAGAQGATLGFQMRMDNGPIQYGRLVADGYSNIGRLVDTGVPGKNLITEIVRSRRLAIVDVFPEDYFEIPSLPDKFRECHFRR